MEYHRNPSPPESPTPTATSQSHDVITTSSTNTARTHDRDGASHEKTASDDSSSLVNSYDDCIGDTVFSKAWVLSLLVKAVEAVREQESKIEMLNRLEDNVHVGDSELSIEERLPSRTISEIESRGDMQVMGMESQECNQPDQREMNVQDTFPECEQTGTSSETSGRDNTCTMSEDQKDMQVRSNGDIDDSSVQQTGKDSMIVKTSHADSDQGERERGDGSDDGGVIDQRNRADLDVDEINESLENDLCRFWDASMNVEVAQFIHEQHGVELLLGVANRSIAPRLTEICIGLLGNMACSEEICIQGLSSSSETVQMLIQFMESSDTRILYETSRLLLTCLSHEKAHPVWLKEIQQSDVIYPAMLFILQGSTNTELLQSSASLLDRLLDSSEQLLTDWATKEMVEAMCEAAEQVRVTCVDATCSLLMTLQLLSTVDKGVQAIVECEAKVFALLSSFLSGLDHLEGHCSPVMAAISLLIALKDNSISDHIKDNLADTDVIETIQRISEQAGLLSEQSKFNASRIPQYSELHTLTLQLL